MSDATTSWNMSPELAKVAERAKQHPDQRILGLAHLIDEPALERAFRGIRRNAAVGVDGITVEQYGGQLATNLHADFGPSRSPKPVDGDHRNRQMAIAETGHGDRRNRASRSPKPVMAIA